MLVRLNRMSKLQWEEELLVVKFMIGLFNSIWIQMGCNINMNFYACLGGERIERTSDFSLNILVLYWVQPSISLLKAIFYMWDKYDTFADQMADQDDLSATTTAGYKVNIID